MRTLVLRLLMLSVSLWFIVTVAFLVVYFLPGDPARLILGQQASTETVEAFRKKSGLNDSLPKQYIRFIRRTCNLDFGNSLVQRRPVIDLILERLPTTSFLVLSAISVVLIFSFFLPLCFHALNMSFGVRLMEKFWTSLALFPPYVSAVGALVIFAGLLGWTSVLFEASHFSNWILPSIILAAYPTGIVLRLFEQQLQSALSSPYSLRAQSIGFNRQYILFFEALPNALTPALAALTNGLAFFITGTFFVEVAFGIPGLGSLTYESIRNKDVFMLTAICILFAISISSISVILDGVLILINPKLRR